MTQSSSAVPAITKTIEEWLPLVAGFDDPLSWVVTRALQAAELEWNTQNDNTVAVPIKEISLQAIWNHAVDKSIVDAFIATLPGE